MKKIFFIFAFLFSAFAWADEGITPVNCDNLSNINWAEAGVISVAMDEYDMSPDDIYLKACTPYRLEIANIGDHHHTFTSKTFFPNVWVYKEGQLELQRLPAGFKTIHVQEGGEESVWLVPSALGTFDFKCEVFGHDWLGMSGEIHVSR